MIIVVGGLGSTSGAVLGAMLFVWGGEALRVVESPMNFGLFIIPGIPGMRMVIFSIILMLVIIFARRGIMGRRELSWDALIARLGFGQRSRA
jgi:branched-chain amino acid transport system permease protein